ncbi:hypothetical protein, partial [Ahrensia sp. R2A130]|uniref:hypothetical protein n=1 Tax=Ahrensia sp. R2A130 TaxID=744979 RepID=UPI0001E0F85D
MHDLKIKKLLIAGASAFALSTASMGAFTMPAFAGDVANTGPVDGNGTPIAGGDDIVDGTVDAADLGTDSVNSDEIASGAVGTDEIADGTVGNADLAG